MKLQDVMTKNVESLGPDAKVIEAARIMKKLNVGVVPVVEGTRLSGIITDRDITLRVTAEGLDPNNTPVRSVMSKDVTSCKQDEDVKGALRLMSSKQIRRLPIVDDANNLVGIVSIGDLAVDTAKDRAVGDTLEDISKPSRPTR